MPNSKPYRRLRRDSSPSSSSDELDASIYFRVRVAGGYDWYVIKNDSTTPQCRILNPIFPPLPEYRVYSACAAVGSRIYVFGGADAGKRLFFPPRFDDAYYIDSLCPEGGWKKGPSMKKPRMQAHAVTADGKVYLMGGTRETEITSPWAEVFDPNKDESWSALSEVPADMPYLITGHAVLDGGKRILLHADASDIIYSYNVEDDSWGVHARNFCTDTNKSALLDGILYYVDYSRPEILFGLDLSKPERLAKPVTASGDEDEDWHWLPQPGLDNIYPHAFVVSLGNGKLAVVWSRVDSLGVVRVRCSKMKMSKVENVEGGFDLVARPISLSTYYAKGFLLYDCLEVFPSEKKEIEEDVSKDDNSTLTSDKSSSSNSNDKTTINKTKNKNKNKNKKKKGKNNNK